MNVSQMQLLQSPDLTPLDFCLEGRGAKCTKERWIHQTNFRIARSHLVAATSIKKSEDKLRRKTRDLSARVVKRVEADSGIFRKYIADFNKFLISV
jgi:hypothetical protein